MSVQNSTISSAPGQTPRASLTRGGLLLGDREVPLLSGSVHYFRLEPNSWRACLEALVDMGCTFVDVYVPWSTHEAPDGSFDFGEKNPALDVRSFLRIAEELGLYALMRPGPHINAELSGFGLPERVLWNPACQARSPAGQPVILPAPPLAFPVPSYASRALLSEACRWLRRVAAELGPLCWPSGPIALCQIDNEGALYFRDGVFDQDYHPDSLERYRSRLMERYGTPARLAEAHGVTADTFDVAPPVRFEAKDAHGLRRQLDWAEHQEASIAEAFGQFRAALAHDGLERVPTCHNLPMGEAGTPLDPAKLGKVVECLGLDYYHVASDVSSDAILRRTSEVATRADAFDYPAFAVELAAGFPPFFPPLTEADNRFAALSCLSAGIRGFNLYMAVERDRWIGAPIDASGRKRPSFEFWRKLNEAVLRTRLYELSRAADVCVVVPRSLHRLERLLHAFGPISAAAFDVMGLTAYDSCLEHGPFASALFEAERFLLGLLRELARLGVAYRVAANDAAAHAMEQSRLSFVVAAGGLEPELWEVVREAAARGKPVAVGPRLPTTTPSGLVPLPPAPPDQYSALSVVGEAELAERVSELCTRYDAARLEDEAAIRASLFRDRGGAPRVLFVTNTSGQPARARITAAGFSGAVDALDGDVFRANVRALEVPLSPHSVRMLELT